jgi:putative phosphoribosyl transferase
MNPLKPFAAHGAAASQRVPIGVQRDVTIRVGGGQLAGGLTVPAGARALVLFAHGSGSSRRSPRNLYVASELQRAGLATVLVDLLTPEEERIDALTSHLRFDVSLLASRLVAISDWAGRTSDTRALPIGYFGASTGAAAALTAAAARRNQVDAVVSRGGRPDLARDAIRQVRAPTLLIVGSRDIEVVTRNRRALEMLSCEKRLAVVPGASHLFDEPGALEHVARSATRWFVTHLPARDRRETG